jgi:hypothetical protein
MMLTFLFFLAYFKVCQRWHQIVAFSDDVVLFPNRLVPFFALFNNICRRCPTSRKGKEELEKRRLLWLIFVSYLVFMGSVYWVPVAASCTDTNALCLAWASSIWRSSSMRFSSSVFSIHAQQKKKMRKIGQEICVSYLVSDWVSFVQPFDPKDSCSSEPGQMFLRHRVHQA